MWEGGAYFKVDTQRSGAYKKAALIRRNMAFLRLAQCHFYCLFVYTPFSYHIPLKHVHLEHKFAHSCSYIKSFGRYLVWSSMSYLILNFCNPPLQFFYNIQNYNYHVCVIQNYDNFVSFRHDSLIDIYRSANFSLFDISGTPQLAFPSVWRSYFCRQTKSDNKI